MRMLGFLTGTIEAANFGDIFDASIVDTLLELLIKFTQLFKIFPINLILISTIAGIAFGLLRKAKKAAVGK